MNSNRITVALAAFAAAIMVSACTTGEKQNAKPVCPPFLQPGDKIAIMAPSFFVEDSVVLEGAAVLEECGYEVEFLTGYAHPYPEGSVPPISYSGSIEERLSEFKRVMEDESVKAVICSRGGYGAIHLVERLEPQWFRSHPKWLVGFSDISYLNIAELMSGVMSIHGNMASELAYGGAESKGNAALLKLLKGELPQYELPAHEYNIEGSATAMLVGGNLESIATMIGSTYDFTLIDNYILFIEEVGESYYDLDRFLNMILQHPEGIRGVIVGDFTDCTPEPYYPSVEAMLDGYLSKLGVPVCYGLHAGHGDYNLPLIEGSTMEMTVTAEGATLKSKL